MGMQDEQTHIHTQYSNMKRGPQHFWATARVIDTCGVAVKELKLSYNNEENQYLQYTYIPTLW